MSDLKKYVDNLFHGYGRTAKLLELKEEILSNLEAKKQDFMARGISGEEAAEMAKKGLTSIDGLIDGNKKVDIDALKKESGQWFLIFLLSEWILTLPMCLFRIGLIASWFFMLLVVIAVIWYRIACCKKNAIGQTSYVFFPKVQKTRKLLWILWGLFVAVSSLATTALYFGSNLWFSRPMTIDGPYELAVILVAYAQPMLTVIIPLMGSMVTRLVLKYEVGERG